MILKTTKWLKPRKVARMWISVLGGSTRGWSGTVCPFHWTSRATGQPLYNRYHPLLFHQQKCHSINGTALIVTEPPLKTETYETHISSCSSSAEEKVSMAQASIYLRSALKIESIHPIRDWQS